jgi:SEC-C motif-containing protein
VWAVPDVAKAAFGALNALNAAFAPYASPRQTGGVPEPCPCGLPASYDACCGRFHRGEAAAPTAELLMRSRYAAFAVGDATYLRETWHPSTRPRRVELDATSWTGLEVLGSTGGGLFDTAGTVAFRAHHRSGVVAEDSAFGRTGGRWFYRGPVSDPFTTPPHRRP